MFLKSLSLQQFRCYKDSFFEFSPGLNGISGANARGKTTILEAIHLLISGKSFRSMQFSDLIQMHAASFYLEAVFVKHQIEQTIKVHFDGKAKKILHNSTSYQSMANLLGIINGGIITPNDVALIKGSPEVRRHFLDLQIAQVNPLYVHHLVRYQRAMRQRNALLRSGKLTTMGAWEHEMALSAAYITDERQKAVSDLNILGQEQYHLLSGETESLEIFYKSSAVECDSSLRKQHFLDQFAKFKNRELALGRTLVGPHKDDLMISIGKKESRFFASEGQQRTCVAALRLAEWIRLKRLSEETPLFLIDDVGISLDSGRKERLLSHVEKLGQVFLTGTEKLPLGAGAILIEL